MLEAMNNEQYEAQEQIENKIRKEQNKKAINLFSKWMAKVVQNEKAMVLLVVVQGTVYDRLLISPENKAELRESIRDFIKENTKLGINTNSVLKGFVVDAGCKCYYFNVETKRIVSTTNYDNLPQLKEVSLWKS